MNPKVFFCTFRPGIGGDFLAQLFSNYHTFYQIPSNRDNNNRYNIIHPLEGHGYWHFKGAYKPEHIHNVVITLNKEIESKFNQKHIIVNSHYYGDLGGITLPRMVPIRMVAQTSKLQFYFCLAVFKLYNLVKNNRTAFHLLVDRLLKDNDSDFSTKNAKAPIEIVRFLWDKQYKNQHYFLGYTELDVWDLGNNPHLFIDRWYNILEIKQPNFENDVKMIADKHRADIKLIEQKYNMPFDQFLNDPLWLSKLEEMVYNTFRKL